MKKELARVLIYSKHPGIHQVVLAVKRLKRGGEVCEGEAATNYRRVAILCVP